MDLFSIEDTHVVDYKVIRSVMYNDNKWFLVFNLNLCNSYALL